MNAIERSYSKVINAPKVYIPPISPTLESRLQSELGECDKRIIGTNSLALKFNAESLEAEYKRIFLGKQELSDEENSLDENVNKISSQLPGKSLADELIGISNNNSNIDEKDFIDEMFGNSNSNGMTLADELFEKSNNSNEQYLYDEVKEFNENINGKSLADEISNGLNNEIKDQLTTENKSIDESQNENNKDKNNIEVENEVPIHSNEEIEVENIVSEINVDNRENAFDKTGIDNIESNINIPIIEIDLVTNEESNDVNKIEESKPENENKESFVEKNKVEESINGNKIEEFSVENKIEESIDGNKVEESNVENKFEESNVENKAEESVDKNKIKESCDEDKIEESDDENKIEKSHGENRIEESQGENKIEELNGDNKINEPTPDEIENINNELVIKEIENINNKPTIVGEVKSEIGESNVGIKTEESNDENKIEESNVRIKIEESNDENKIEESNDENKIEKSNDENKIEESNDENKIEESNDENKNVLNDKNKIVNLIENKINEFKNDDIEIKINEPDIDENRIDENEVSAHTDEDKLTDIVENENNEPHEFVTNEVDNIINESIDNRDKIEKDEIPIHTNEIGEPVISEGENKINKSVVESTNEDKLTNKIENKVNEAKNVVNINNNNESLINNETISNEKNKLINDKIQSVKEEKVSPSPLDNLMRIEKENELKGLISKLKEAIHLNENQIRKIKKNYITKQLVTNNKDRININDEEDTQLKKDLTRKESFSSIASRKSIASSIISILSISGIKDPKILKILKESNIIHDALIQCMNYIEKDFNGTATYKSPFSINKEKELNEDSNDSNILYSFSNNPSFTSLSEQNDLPQPFLIQKNDIEKIINSFSSIYSDESNSSLHQLSDNNINAKKPPVYVDHTINIDNMIVRSQSDSSNFVSPLEEKEKTKKLVASIFNGNEPSLSMPSIYSHSNTSLLKVDDEIVQDNSQRPPLHPSYYSQAQKINDKTKHKMDNSTNTIGNNNNNNNFTISVSSEPDQIESNINNESTNSYPNELNNVKNDNKFKKFENNRHLSIPLISNDNKRISIYSLNEKHLSSAIPLSEDKEKATLDKPIYKLIKKKNSTDSLENVNILETKPIEDIYNPLQKEEELLLFDNDMESITGTFGNRNSSLYNGQNKPMLESVIKNKMNLTLPDINNKKLNEVIGKSSLSNCPTIDQELKWEQTNTEVATESTDTNIIPSEFETTTSSFITNSECTAELLTEIPMSNNLYAGKNNQLNSNADDNDSLLTSNSVIGEEEEEAINKNKNKNQANANTVNEPEEKSNKIDYTNTLDNLESSICSWSEEIINQQVNGNNIIQHDELEHDFATLGRKISSGQLKVDDSFIIENKENENENEIVNNEVNFYDTLTTSIEDNTTSNTNNNDSNNNKEKEKEDKENDKKYTNTNVSVFNNRKSSPTKTPTIEVNDYSKPLFRRLSREIQGYNGSNGNLLLNLPQINRYSGIPAADNFIPSIFNKPKVHVNSKTSNPTILSKGKTSDLSFNNSYFKLRDNTSEILRNLSANADEDYLYSINILRRTMNGTWMYKFNRFGKNPHLRYVWIHPFNKLIYWSRREPSDKFKHQIKTKSEYIQNVSRTELKTKYKDMINCYPHLINVKTPQRTLQISALNKEDFDIWYTAIQSLIHKFEGYNTNNDLICLNYNKYYNNGNSSIIDDEGNITTSINQSSILNNNYMNSDIPIYESSEVKNSKSKGNDSILSLSVKSFISSALPSKSNIKNSDNHTISNTSNILPSSFKSNNLRRSSVLSNHEIPTLSEINNRLGDRSHRLNNNKDDIHKNSILHDSSISQVNETSSNNLNANTSNIFKRHNDDKSLSIRSFPLNLNGNEKRLPKDDRRFPKGKRLSLSSKNFTQYFHSGNFSKKKKTAASIHSVNLGPTIDVKRKRSISFMSIDPIFRKSSVNSKNKVDILDEDDYESSVIINESRQSVRKCSCHNSNHHHHH